MDSLPVTRQMVGFFVCQPAVAANKRAFFFVHSLVHSEIRIEGIRRITLITLEWLDTTVNVDFVDTQGARQLELSITKLTTVRHHTGVADSM